MKVNNKYILFFMFWTIVISCFYFFGKDKISEIEKNKQICTGRICGHGYSGAGRVALHYSFKVNNQLFFSKGGPTIKSSNFQHFNDKYFPVFYSKINPEKNAILIFPRSFEKWDLVFPDSLEWVKQYEKW